MRRQLIAFASGLVAWWFVASLLNRLLRVGLTGYEAAEPTMDFTLSMQCARLILGALASLGAGYVLSLLAPGAWRLPLLFGGLMLALFLPVHYRLWLNFPLWYHLIFLLSIIPFVVLGAWLGTRSSSTAGKAAIASAR